MGVPGFFVWLQKNYKRDHKLIIKNMKEDFDELYIDANCLFHPQCFKILELLENTKSQKELEELMISRIEAYLTFLINKTKVKRVFIAVDGVAPMAKMNQQRKRRFMSMHENKLRDDIKKKHGIDKINTWSNTCITPGTEFMEKLHVRLLTYIKKKKEEIIYSSYHTPGEGEHKILDHIRKQKKNINRLIYGLDADLIFLALASQKSNIYLLREEMFVRDKDTNNRKIDDIVNDVEQDLVYVSIDTLKRCINITINNIINERSGKTNYKDHNFCNDFIFLCYLLGNDFIPHIPSVDIKIGGLDILITTYVDIFIGFDNNRRELIFFNRGDVFINFAFLKLILKNLSNKEDYYFKKIYSKHRDKMDSRICMNQDVYKKEMWNFDNLGEMDIEDSIRLGEDDYKFRYYESYFNIVYQDEHINNICREYFSGLIWVTKYYFKGCESWYWQYPFSHGPFISDLYHYMLNYQIDINIKDKRESISPCTQLLAVLPPQCYKLLPKSYQKLVLDFSSIIDMYPNQFDIDMINKDMRWKCIPMIPTVDIDRIIDATSKLKLNKKEKIRDLLKEDFKNY